MHISLYVLCIFDSFKANNKCKGVCLFLCFALLAHEKKIMHVYTIFYGQYHPPTFVHHVQNAFLVFMSASFGGVERTAASTIL